MLDPAGSVMGETILRSHKSLKRWTILIVHRVSLVGVVGLQPRDLANGILHSYTSQEEVIDDLIIRQLV